MSKKAMLSVGVFALLLVLTLLTREENAKSGMRELALPTVSADDLVEVSIAGKYQAHLRRGDEGWTVAAPDKPEKRFATDKAAVDRMLEAVSTLEPGPFVTARKEKQADLEVDEEKGVVVSLVTKDGKNLELVFGRAAKGGGNYLRLKRSDEVFVGKGDLAAQLKKNTDQWRNKKLVSAQTDAIKALDVKGLDVKGPAASYTILRKGAEKPFTYELSAELPEGYRASSEALARVVRSFAGLTASGFVDEPGPLAPELTLAATLDDGSTVEMQLGPTADKKAELQLKGDAQRYTVSEYGKKNLAKSLDELRDLSLFAGLDASKVASLVFDGAEGKYTITKDGESWTFDGPKGADTFDPGAVMAKLAGLARLKAARFLGDKAAVKASFKAPLTLTLSLDDGSARTLRVGDAVTGDAEAKNLVYADPGDGFVYGFSSYQKDRYAKAYDVFKKVEAHQGMPGMGQMPGGGMGGIQGLESLPPEIRKQLEAQLKQQGLGR